MYCKYCGNSIDEDSVFCSKCGQKINEKKEKDFFKIKTLQNDKENHQEKSQEKFLDLQKGTETTYNPIFSKFDEIPILDVDDIKDIYQKESEATFIGILIILISFVLTIFKPFTFETEETYYEYLRYASIAALAFRLIGVFWVVSIAKRQRRNETSWGVFAFFLPAIALIIIGQLKKLSKQITLDNFLDNEENSEELLKKAKNYFEEKNYRDAIIYTKKSMELNSQNNDAKNFLRKITLKIPSESCSNKEIQTVYRELKTGDIIKIISKNYQTIGAKVFIKNAVAQDNIYEYKNDSRKIFVKNGRIEKIQN